MPSHPEMPIPADLEQTPVASSGNDAQVLRRVTAFVAVLALAGCSFGARDEAAREDASAAGTNQAQTLEPPPSLPTTAPPSTAPPISAPARTAPAQAEGSDAGPPAGCVLLTDFETDQGRQRWQSVNDDVMGGQSEGRLSFADGVLIFEGTINTNGGGFSSIRTPIDSGTLAGFSSIAISVTPDERSYMVTLEDQADGRNRRVNHRAAIGPSGAGQPAVDTLAFTDFVPAIFGQPVDDSPVEPETINELGLMISDGTDGPFRLEVAWIVGCR